MSTQFAQIEPTTRCNYTCGFCAGSSMRQGDLPWQVFERFLEANPSLQHVELQGEGEPLMHPRFFDMVSACRARCIKVSLITNGSLFSHTTATRLIEHQVESVHISLESADLAEFREIRGGNLRKVIEGIRRLMSRRRELQKDRPTVGFAVTVLRRTLAAIPGIVALYGELELDGGISIQPLQDMSCYTQGYRPEMLQEIVPADLWRSCRPLINGAAARVSVQRDAGSFYGSLFAGFDPLSCGCPWLEHGAYLNIDGQVMPCAFTKKPADALGNAIDGPIERIEHNRLALARTLASGAIPASCEGCGVAAAVTGTQPTRLLPVLPAAQSGDACGRDDAA